MFEMSALYDFLLSVEIICPYFLQFLQSCMDPCLRWFGIFYARLIGAGAYRHKRCRQRTYERCSVDGYISVYLYLKHVSPMIWAGGGGRLGRYTPQAMSL